MQHFVGAEDGGTDKRKATNLPEEICSSAAQDAAKDDGTLAAFIYCICFVEQRRLGWGGPAVTQYSQRVASQK